VNIADIVGGALQVIGALAVAGIAALIVWVVIVEIGRRRGDR
jgi:hypothetical protein